MIISLIAFIRHSRRFGPWLLLLSSLLLLVALSACGADATATAITGQGQAALTEVATQVNGMDLGATATALAANPAPALTAVATTASGASADAQAALNSYAQMVQNQQWDQLANLFTSNVDAATRTKVVQDLVAFVASGGPPTSVDVQNVTQNGAKATAQIVIKNSTSSLTQNVTLVQANGVWQIDSINSSTL